MPPHLKDNQIRKGGRRDTYSTKRQANQHDYPPCLLGDVDKEIEIVYR
jgi:hypothetical protein